MKREEEIEKMSNEYANENKNEWWGGHSYVDDSIELKLAVEYGVDWADKHPREGLWDKDKVCKYIKEYAPIDYDCDGFIEDLCLAS